RSAIPNLDQLPGKNRLKHRLSLIPEVNVVGKHDVDAVVVLTGEHDIKAINLSGKNSHSLVFSRRTIQRDESKAEEVRGFNELRHNHSAVVGGKSRIIDVSAIVIPETNESGIFDAIPLG